MSDQVDEQAEEIKKFSGYPSFRYKLDEKNKDHENPHKRLKSKVVHSAEEDKELGPEWKPTPAHHGIETHPGSRPDLKITGGLAAEPRGEDADATAVDETSVKDKLLAMGFSKKDLKSKSDEELVEMLAEAAEPTA